ncbi:preprotein translocase subunit Tim44 [Erwinia psidii]|uniref:Preprotein translocase subunit Tim44 n=2 Tax=Erwinia psidii TaxID=69224 RepID=A0A3N6SPG8_9GAMM|nr:preprotein translocase subunit Tim44 [Erwinia psidii]MCX8960525.1 preprotein translocase subunit Tim44 [Erwinia psidii]MCX8964230.1 preprotein translocase subunit Tim44 [Erwinia psidii]RQM39706.1 preprotein translocase subunit Tim44 [Erwinia psidii]
MTIYDVEKEWCRIANAVAKTHQNADFKYYSYQDFRSLVPIMDKDGFAAQTERYLESNERNCLIGFTSGTSGNLKRCYYYYDCEVDEDSSRSNVFRSNGFIQPGDCCANLFTINLFSALNNITTMMAGNCGANVVSVGDIKLLTKSHFDALNSIKLNVLLGVPSTILQFIDAMQQHGVHIAIEKVVFNGEGLKEFQKKIIREAFGEQVSIVGIYGSSEGGILGFTNSTCHTEYEFLSNKFFIEKEGDSILITSLTRENFTPLLRYRLGDTATLLQKEGKLFLRGIQREDMSFNFMGNLVSMGIIQQAIKETLGRSLEIQIHLSVSEVNKELVTVFVPANEIDEDERARIETAIADIPDINEAYQKSQGSVAVLRKEARDYAVSERGKMLFIIDRRN